MTIKAANTCYVDDCPHNPQTGVLLDERLAPPIQVASLPFPTPGFLSKAVVDGQQRFFPGLARVAIGEDERERT